MDLPKGLQGEHNISITAIYDFKVMNFYKLDLCLSCFSLLRGWACMLRQNAALCHRQRTAHQPSTCHRTAYSCSGEKSWSLAQHSAASLQGLCGDR